VSSYEQDVQRIEEIVSELERDDLELDRALQLFEEGIARLRGAAESLSRVEAQVRTLVERSDGTFEPPAHGG
jgi:exodeoxyribonuclease VII small subunit